MKKTPCFALIFILNFALFAFCVYSVECGDTINSRDFQLDRNLECADTGLTLKGDGINFNCNSHFIKGGLSGNGIAVYGSGIKISGCEIYNFENGILIEHSDSFSADGNVLRNNLNGFFVRDSKRIAVSGNTIKDNANFGIYSVSVEESNYYNNKFENTGIEVMDLKREEPEHPPLIDVQKNATSPEKKSGASGTANESANNATATQEKKEEFKPQIIEISSQVTDALLEELGIPKWKHEQIKNTVKIHKKATIYANKTVYEISALSSENLDKLSVYEYFPQKAIGSQDEILSDTQFVALKDSRLLKFNIGKVKKGEEVRITYTISKRLFREINPVSIFTLEETLNPSGLLSIRVLFGLLIILFIANWYLKERVHPHLKYRGIELVLILSVIIFIMLNMELQIEISESWNNVIVIALFTLIMIYYVSRDLRYYRELKKEQEEGLDV